MKHNKQKKKKLNISLDDFIKGKPSNYEELREKNNKKLSIINTFKQNIDNEKKQLIEEEKNVTLINETFYKIVFTHSVHEKPCQSFDEHLFKSEENISSSSKINLSNVVKKLSSTLIRLIYFHSINQSQNN